MCRNWTLNTHDYIIFEFMFEKCSSNRNMNGHGKDDDDGDAKHTQNTTVRVRLERLTDFLAHIRRMTVARRREGVFIQLCKQFVQRKTCFTVFCPVFMNRSGFGNVGISWV